MKKILIFGAGMVVKPMAHYLLDHGFYVTLASRTLAKAEKVLNGYSNCKAVSWTIEALDELDELIATHDLTVSLLPYVHHVTVAKKCIAHKKNMVTTSYVSDEMKRLDDAAKAADIIILNELGVDPGYDHMTAMAIIDRVHEANGKIDEFYSLCGALCAPEAADNPFKYKFSWSPKGVVMASNNSAQFLKNGKVVSLPTQDLFKNPLQIVFPEVGQMEVYPNRDSLAYIELYGIPEVSTMYRGTFRYQNWCTALDLLKALGLTNYDELNVKGKTYAEITAHLNGLEVGSLKDAIKAKFNIDDKNLGFKAIEWLGILDDEVVPFEKASTFDLVSDLMVNKMILGETERDMVIMQHIFKITQDNGEKKTLVSRMCDFGNDDYTSISRTVALPAAIGIKLILENKIHETGVHIPVKQSIYAPILKALETLGITMIETEEELDL